MSDETKKITPHILQSFQETEIDGVFKLYEQVESGEKKEDDLIRYMGLLAIKSMAARVFLDRDQRASEYFIDRISPKGQPLQETPNKGVKEKDINRMKSMVEEIAGKFPDVLVDLTTLDESVDEETK